MAPPSMYTPELVDEVLSRVSEGEPLAAVCRDLKIGLTTWYDWEKRYSLAERVARAREAGEEMIAVDTMAIIDEEPERIMSEQGSRVDPGYVAWQKNRAEQRMKLLKCWNPRKWGEKVALGGAEDLPPIKTQTDVALDDRLAELLAKNGANES